MMKKRAKVLTALGACAVCAVMVGGAAYAIAPAVEEAEDQVAADTEQAQMAEAFSDAYANSTKLLALDGLDEEGNPIAFASGSPAIIGADQQAGAAAAATGAAAEGTEATEGEGDADAAQPALEPQTLVIFGNVIPCVDCFGATSAPAHSAGLWKGSDSTTDGSWGYFIGHHPGVFNCVMYLSAGDEITVCDHDGNTATYTVFAAYDIPNTMYWEQLEPDVTGHGESITLQTCYGDGATDRIVQAA